MNHLLLTNKLLCRHRSATKYNTLKRMVIGVANYEPPYLEEAIPEIPVYPPLNVQIKGYDYTVLERFSSWVHHTSVHLKLEVEKCWATPSQNLSLKTFKEGTYLLQSAYDLNIYERNIQIVDLPSTIAPTFCEVIKAALPSGVELSIHEHMKEYDDVCLIPDLQLRQLVEELDDLGGPSKKHY